MKKLIILLILVPIISFSQEKDFDFDSIERPPIYPGCDINIKNKLLRSCFVKEIRNHIARNFRYPEFAQKKGIQGRVFVQFIIGTGGYVEQIRARGPDPILETEAKRIISLIPKLTPGRVDGKAVRVPFSISITFRLAGKKSFNN